MSAAPRVKSPVTAEDLRARLRRRHLGDEWAFFEEVANATGFAKSRSADAIAVALWPSRGLEVHGFEIKASRGDWLRELKDPWKAEAIGKYCDRWWLVVADKAMVKPGELPDAWGVLAPRGDDLAVVVEAKKNEQPTPLDRVFFAALCRAASKEKRAAIAAATAPTAKALLGEWSRGYEDGKEAAKGSMRFDLEERDRLKGVLAAFETETGVPLASQAWREDRAKEIGAIVRAVLRAGPSVYRGHLERAARQLRSIADDIDTARTEGIEP